jgi:hypothetical protein
MIFLFVTWNRNYRLFGTDLLIRGARKNTTINKDLFKHKLQRERCIHVQTNAVRSS